MARNGYLPEREIQTGIGPVKIKMPKIRDKSGRGIKFNLALLPPYLRKIRQCILVIIGVTEHGLKEFIATEDGYREYEKAGRNCCYD